MIDILELIKENKQLRRDITELKQQLKATQMGYFNLVMKLEEYEEQREEVLV